MESVDREGGGEKEKKGKIKALHTFTLNRLWIRIIGLADTSWVDKKNSMDYDLADSFNFHVYYSGLWKATIQELVSDNVPYVHHLDWIVELCGRMDDHYNW